MALNIQVISSKCGGPEQILNNGLLGSLFSPGDVVGLSSLLDEVICSPGKQDLQKEASIYDFRNILKLYADEFGIAVDSGLPASGVTRG
jgi:hypothetical protein